jgi:hypothetical protein
LQTCQPKVSIDIDIKIGPDGDDLPIDIDFIYLTDDFSIWR